MFTSRLAKVNWRKSAAAEQPRKAADMRFPANLSFLVRAASVAFVFMIAAGFVLLGPASFGPGTTEAAGFTVDSTADASDANPGDGTCATAGGACTLRAAIEEANALAGSDSVSVPAGVYTLSLGQLTLASGLTLGGAGASSTIIDGNGLSRVLQTSGVVVISDLTIRNGSDAADYGAGGIYNGGTLTLNNTTVSGNSSTGEYATS